ncbi:dihydrolipoyl dehydrogenase [Anoxynatronum buryatiense]|uniref:Dihydrolipoyl dehydrogenase n=1 Tax=Anoxynatronum buryatiense TaxID=489973 RepID=A0AA46AJD6_9CLOT|nr:dihydrolipoyl dehydrogenase [Anoxynatronum buryatiense]SMP60365.1 dihydrolipoamide dehydrogenase [Anoxynatronum buryatiense]
MKKELVIIGAGPGGYVAAIRAAQLGAQVTLIEGRDIGGTCLNRGCISTKALYTNAKKINELKEMAHFGIQLEGFTIDFDTIQERKQSVVTQLVSGIERLLKAYKVEIIKGWATLQADQTIAVAMEDGSTQILEAAHILLAAGSKPSILPVEGADLPGVITSDDLLNIEHVPKRLAVAGSGVIGIELAAIFQAFGSEVTVISSTLLKRMDGEMVKRVQPYLKKQGLNLLQDCRVTGVTRENEVLTVEVRNKKTGDTDTVTADVLLMAPGREPMVDRLGLEAAGVAHDAKGIRVNDNFETNVPGIYAIGDALGGMMLAHVASHQGIAAVERIMGHTPEIRLDVVPDCVFMDPQLAGVGKTEEELKEAGIPYISGKFLFGANGKALAMGETDGFVKILAREDDHRLLGAHIMGPHASDLIHELALALAHDMTLEDVANTIHAHPTLAESVLEAVLATKGEAIHNAPPRKPKK